nr:DEAD/DEAH box helicase [Clostridioides mangenotii]
MQEFIPHPYQEYAINRTIDTNKIGLFLDMGLGKTACTLTAIQELKFDYLDVNKVLVIAPLKVAESTWSTEVEKWEPIFSTDFYKLKISKVLGTKPQREKALKENADIYVTNRENTKWIVDHFKKEWPFDMIVIDELSSFKDNKTQRFKSLKKILPYANRIVGLTGTPAPNSLMDLWPQIYILDRGERLGETISGYRDRYFNPGDKNYQTGAIYNWELKDKAEEAIHKQIDDICVSMKKEDYLKMPERINNNVLIELDSKSYKKYKELEKEKVLEFNEDEVVSAKSAAVVSNKLLQLANGAIYDDDKKVQEIHNAKLEALAEIIDTANEKPVLVFYSYKHDLDRIKEKFKKLNPREIKSDKDIKDWNAGKIKLLLCHPASTGHGLNLQAGGNIVVWFGLTWSLEYYQQANARLHRQGQKENVIVNHLICKGTIDEQVIEALESKDQTQSKLLEAVKAKLKEYKS